MSIKLLTRKKKKRKEKACAWSCIVAYDVRIQDNFSKQIHLNVVTLLCLRT